MAKQKKHKINFTWNKKVRKVMSTLCYIIGIVAALYIGVWLMFVKPGVTLVGALLSHRATIKVLITSCVKLLFAGTTTGFVWCLGYVGYNYFKGDEDSDWERINARVQQNQDGKCIQDEGGEAL